MKNFSLIFIITAFTFIPVNTTASFGGESQLTNEAVLTHLVVPNPEDPDLEFEAAAINGAFVLQGTDRIMTLFDLEEDETEIEGSMGQ